LLPAEGTDVNTHSTGLDPGDLVPQAVAILLATVDVKAGLARLVRIEGATRESPWWTGFDAKLAIGTPVGERAACFKPGRRSGRLLQRIALPCCEPEAPVAFAVSPVFQ